MNRYKIVIEKFSMTKFTPEALYRMTEIYYTIGMFEEAKNTASIIGYNYPDSKWYKLSYNLVSENNEEDMESNVEMPPQRDIRETQPTISVNYRVVKNMDDNNLKKDRSYSNNPDNKDDWDNGDNDW